MYFEYVFTWETLGVVYIHSFNCLTTSSSVGFHHLVLRKVQEYKIVYIGLWDKIIGQWEYRLSMGIRSMGHWKIASGNKNIYCDLPMAQRVSLAEQCEDRRSMKINTLTLNYDLPIA